ncbi:MAG TPA: peptide MFS transporter [Vicinamibacterales bacterium]|nr:peptide MFS transporter [Vicinamibacterales bacterium]
MTSRSGITDDHSFFGHPRGLSTLFFTEMWERFSYYGLRALLILFMTAAPAAGGLGFDAPTAGAVYGLYVSMVYMTTLPGGWIADRLIGPQRAVFYGGVIIAAGHFTMAIPSLTTFYLGLVLVVLGTGLLKGNVSVIVGRLYAADDVRRDAGYSIFYVGINLGAFLAPIICGYLGQRVNWHLGFGAAGVGMTIGLVQYALGRRHLGEAGLEAADPGTADARRKQRRQAQTTLAVFAIVLACAVIGIAIGVIPVTPTALSDAAGYFLLILTVAFFGWLYFSGSWTARERKQNVVIGVLFLAAALFWSEFEQAGSTLNLFADRDTNNTVLGWDVPSSFYQSLNSLFIFALGPAFAWFWIYLGRRRKEPSSAAKFGIGLVLVGAGFAVLALGAIFAQQGMKVSPLWLVATYLLHTCGELTLSPVGLSAMSKLAPVRLGGLIMGVWFLGSSVGNYIGGRMGGLYESMALPPLFGNIAAFGVACGILLLLFARRIARLERGESEAERVPHAAA